MTRTVYRCPRCGYTLRLAIKPTHPPTCTHQGRTSTPVTMQEDTK